MPSPSASGLPVLVWAARDLRALVGARPRHRPRHAGISSCASSRTRPSTRCSARCSLRALDRELPALALGIAYAVTDELHQHFVQGRTGAPLDVLIDAVGVVVGVLPGAVRDSRGSVVDRRDRPRRARRHAPALARLARGRRARARCRRAVGGSAPPRPPSSTRRGAGNWRTLLERFAEDRAPVYLRRRRRSAPHCATLQAEGAQLVVFTDAPLEFAASRSRSSARPAGSSACSSATPPDDADSSSGRGRSSLRRVDPPDDLLDLVSSIARSTSRARAATAAVSSAALVSSRRKASHWRGPSTRTTRAPGTSSGGAGSSRSTTSVRSGP